jgi:hypothetical protein
MAEMSGIEMIQVLLKEMALLQKKVDLLDLNLKRLMNEGRTKSKPKAVPAEAPPKEVKKGIHNFKFESDKVKPKPTCMCEGKMVINNGGKSTSLSGLTVKIFDGQNNEVRKTRTNKSGEWRLKLPVGRFVALIEGKFGKKPLYPVNLTFEVLPGMKKLEVK